MKEPEGEAVLLDNDQLISTAESAGDMVSRHYATAAAADQSADGIHVVPPAARCTDFFPLLYKYNKNWKITTYQNEVTSAVLQRSENFSFRIPDPDFNFFLPDPRKKG
jgi:hypothetical protein